MGNVTDDYINENNVKTIHVSLSGLVKILLKWVTERWVREYVPFIAVVERLKFTVTVSCIYGSKNVNLPVLYCDVCIIFLIRRLVTLSACALCLLHRAKRIGCSDQIITELWNWWLSNIDRVKVKIPFKKSKRTEYL